MSFIPHYRGGAVGGTVRAQSVSACSVQSTIALSAVSTHVLTVSSSQPACIAAQLLRGLLSTTRARWYGAVSSGHRVLLESQPQHTARARQHCSALGQLL